VVLACTAHEAARLARPHASAWSRQAEALVYEPIVTVYVQSRGTRLPEPMTLLVTNSDAPAQFVFDLGAIDGGGRRDGVFAFVISGARHWVEQGLDRAAAATLRQGQLELSAFWREPPRLLRTLAERRATFLCTAALDRPAALIAPGLTAAGDYVAGPYPATLEGAVRSGGAAIAALDFGAAPAAPVKVSGSEA